MLSNGDGHRLVEADAEYLVFPSMEQAPAYSKQKVSESPEIECIIVDDKKEVLDTVKNWEYISQITEKAKELREIKKMKSSWWKLR